MREVFFSIIFFGSSACNNNAFVLNGLKQSTKELTSTLRSDLQIPLAVSSNSESSGSPRETIIPE